MILLVTFDNISRQFINRTFKVLSKEEMIRKCVTANEVVINIIEL